MVLHSVCVGRGVHWPLSSGSFCPAVDRWWFWRVFLQIAFPHWKWLLTLYSTVLVLERLLAQLCSYKHTDQRASRWKVFRGLGEGSAHLSPGLQHLRGVSSETWPGALGAVSLPRELCSSCTPESRSSAQGEAAAAWEPHSFPLVLLLRDARESRCNVLSMIGVERMLRLGLPCEAFSRPWPVLNAGLLCVIALHRWWASASPRTASGPWAAPCSCASSTLPSCPRTRRASWTRNPHPASSAASSSCQRWGQKRLCCLPVLYVLPASVLLFQHWERMGGKAEVLVAAVRFIESAVSVLCLCIWHCLSSQQHKDGDKHLAKMMDKRLEFQPFTWTSHLETNKGTDVQLSTVRVAAASVYPVHPTAKEGIFPVFNLIWSYFVVKSQDNKWN